MIPIVPNMHDVIVGAKPPSCSISDVSKVGSRSQQASDGLTLSVSLTDPRFHFRAFAPHPRSSQRDFIQSMRVTRTDASSRPPSRGLSSYNPFDDPDDRSSYLSSVHVVPNSSGGYEVYRSPAYQRESLGESFYDPHSAKGNASGKLTESRALSHSIDPRPESITQSVARRGTQFSRNIGNPAMRKMVNDKLQEATSRVEIFKSTNSVADTGNNSTLASQNASLNKHVVTTTASNIVGHLSSQNSSSFIDSASDLNFSGYSPRTSPTSAVLAASSSRQLLGSISESRSATRLEGNGSTSAFGGGVDNISYSFHQSLEYSNPHREPLAGSYNHNTMSGVEGTPNAKGNNRRDSLTASTSTFTSEQGGRKTPSLLGLFRKRYSPRKLDQNSERTVARSRASSPTPSIISNRTQFSIQPSLQPPKRNSSNATTAANNNGPDTECELECSCKVYHSHKFSGEVVNMDIEARKERRMEAIMTSIRLEEENRVDHVDDPRNVFWIPALSFHPYQHGDKKVVFSSLWPKYKELREHLQNSGIQQTVLKDDAVMDLCTLACTCGPAHLLRCLVDLGLIRVDQVLESGSGLLHLALLAHNLESAKYLMDAKISPKIRDRQGLTADQVCYNHTIRKQMAPRYVLSRDVSRDKVLSKPSLQDKDTIFKMASSPQLFVDLQKKLQTLDFNVNTECDNNGDFLLHIAVRKGLNQLPLLMALIKIQGADIELCNADGMTSLMLAASSGNCVLCDVLICLFGADPNKPNSQSGRSALHYATEGNHRKTVECLIRRGADVNLEDHEGLQADDIPSCIAASDDCREVIMFNRTRRLEMLSDKVKTGEVVVQQLLKSDLCVVDSDGHTLVMIAAIYNRFQTLHCLLELSTSTINAQHSKTGMTALAIAARMGNVEAVSVLLRHMACPTIMDMSGYLPIHHAVLSNHENTVDAFLEHFPDTFVGLFKGMRLCKKTSIHNKLKAAWSKRQESIVTPKLLGCALSGDAEELFQLLDEGDNINPKSGTGNWPLYLAVENGHLDVLKLLFEKGGDIRKRHPTTGATALHVAAKMGHQSIVSFLLQYCRQSRKKTAPKVKDRSQKTPRQNTNQEKRKRLMDVNAVDKDNKTALQLAAEQGFSRIVELLLSHGATTAMLDSEGNLVTCPQYEGVRIMIESHRQQHTRQIIKCIEDKSRKALGILQDIWLPKFDHHLRNKEGNTPLMVAAACGKVQILNFLLQSAVYAEVAQYESDSDSDSDADSGVLDPGDRSKLEDDFINSHDIAPAFYTLSLDLPSDTKRDLFNPDQQTGLTDSTERFNQTRLSRIVTDANRPKGLAIFHDGLLSHVCAVNLIDGTTALHQAVRNSDCPQILSMLLERDATPLNMQDDRGETVLHTACRTGRKKCVEMLLARPYLDLNIRTLDGQLPEEVTSSKAIHKMVEKARGSSAAVPDQMPQLPITDTSVIGSDKSRSLNGSTVNFDKVHKRYEQMRHNSED